MIGSIGAESRYSTGYNNLKPNRNQNKWADTLAQTVDKEDISSRADINRAKKSTVMDSYLALSGKTINTLNHIIIFFLSTLLYTITIILQSLIRNRKLH
jgi:hypothetical protein